MQQSVEMENELCVCMYAGFLHCFQIDLHSTTAEQAVIIPWSEMHWDTEYSITFSSLRKTAVLYEIWEVKQSLQLLLTKYIFALSWNCCNTILRWHLSTTQLVGHAFLALSSDLCFLILRIFSHACKRSRALRLNFWLVYHDNSKINLSLTEREGTEEYWPEVVAVQTERSGARTKTTEGQYSLVRLEQARLLSSLLHGTRAMLFF